MSTSSASLGLLIGGGGGQRVPALATRPRRYDVLQRLTPGQPRDGPRGHVRYHPRSGAYTRSLLSST
jgi:hypothetical protein